MIKVALINPPINSVWNSRPDEDAAQLGIAYIASFLEEKGFKADLFECDIQKISFDEIFEVIKSNNYEMVGISTYSYNFKNAVRLANKFSRLENRPFIFMGGYVPTISYSTLYKVTRCIDCCVIGEGEETVYELAEAIKEGKSWQEIKGIVYKKNGELIETPRRENIASLDMLPFPKRIMLEGKSAAILMSRGCYGRCSFCAAPKFYKKNTGKVIRMRSPENVVKEIKSLIDNYGIETFKFNDDNFMQTNGENDDWIERFCSELKSKEINISFRAMLRANDIVKKRSKLELLKEAGLRYLFIGIESFVQRQLDYFNKNITVEINVEAISVIKELGLKTRIGFIMLDPYSTIDEIIENLNMIKDTNCADIIIPKHDLMSNINALMPIVGTEFYDNMQKASMLIKEDPYYCFQSSDVEVFYRYSRSWSSFISNINLYVNSLFDDNFVFDESLYDIKKQLYNLDVDFLLNIAKNIKNYGLEESRLNSLYEEWRHRLENFDKDIRGRSYEYTQRSET